METDEMTAAAVKQVIVIRRDLKMRRGKEIAQGAHASVAWLASTVLDAIDVDSRTATVTIDAIAFAWLTTSNRKITLQVQSEAELVELHARGTALGLKSHLIVDSGKTEFDGVATITALAIGPDNAQLIDEITGTLAIY